MADTPGDFARSDPVFRRVSVEHLVRGRTSVTWSLLPGFCDPDPWDAKLQWGHTGNPDASDWADVAPYARDAGLLVDATPRDDLGTAWRLHYRVVLRTPLAEYTSRPAPALGPMQLRKWLEIQAIVRKERLRMRRADAARGWLLKRKREGTIPDPADTGKAVTSFLGGEISNSRRASTAGTAYLGGYYAPIPFDVDFTPAGTHERVEPQARGTVDDTQLRQRGRFVCDPLVASLDAFVAAGSDERFYIHEIDYLMIVGRRPVIATGDFRLAPRSDVLYGVAVPSIDPNDEETYCG
jgi:hypothetical protein